MQREPNVRSSAGDVPLSTEPITGWRAWQLMRTPGGLRLLALAWHTEWTPHQPVEASCGVALHTAPAFTCSCGLYATSSRSTLEAIVGQAGPSVVGTVSMWGTVVEHRRGARASRAYPSRLALVCWSCVKFGDGFVVPVWVVEDEGRLTASCSAHLTEGTTPVPAAGIQTELLSVYGVDPLPLPVPVLRVVPTPLRRVVRRGMRSVTASIGTLSGAVLALVKLVVGIVFGFWMLSTFLMVVAVIISAGVTGVQGLLGLTADQPPLSPPPPSVVRLAERQKPAAVLPHGLERPAPRLPAAFVFPEIDLLCGNGRGKFVETVSCESPGYDLAGLAVREPPQGARHDCIDDAIAYSRGESYWICWWAEVEGDLPNVRPWPSAEDPFP